MAASFCSLKRESEVFWSRRTENRGARWSKLRKIDELSEAGGRRKDTAIARAQSFGRRLAKGTAAF